MPFIFTFHILEYSITIRITERKKKKKQNRHPAR